MKEYEIIGGSWEQDPWLVTQKRWHKYFLQGSLASLDCLPALDSDTQEEGFQPGNIVRMVIRDRLLLRTFGVASYLRPDVKIRQSRESLSCHPGD